MKKLIAAVCTVSMVMGSISFGAMAEEEALEITKQPTAGNPTVEVNKTEDVEYQWYDLLVEKYEIVDTEEELEDDQINIDLIWEGYYDEGKWYSGGYGNDCGIDIRFEVEFGDKIVVEVPSDFDGVVKEYEKQSFENIDGVYEKIIESDSGLFNLYMYSEKMFTANIYIVKCDLENSIAIESENGATLKNPELGKIYACKVVSDEEELFSNYFEYKLRISKQPTTIDPTVELNIDVDATYQWYHLVQNDSEVVWTEENLGDSQVNVTKIYGGSYTNGKWYGELEDDEYYLGIDVDVESGEEVVIVLPEDCEASVEGFYFVDDDFDSGEELRYVNGSYVKVIENYEGVYGIDIYSDEAFTADIFIRNDEEIAIEGETGAKLTNWEINEKYVCKVLYEEIELISKVLDYKLEISKQPTGANPTIELNYDVDATYQWYNTKSKEYEVVYGDAGDNQLPSIGGSANYEDNKWQSENRQLGVVFEVTKGDKVIVQLPESFAGTIIDYYSMISGGTITSLTAFEYENGVCEIEIDSEQNMFMLMMADSKDFTVKIYVQKAEISTPITGENTATLKNWEVGNSYVCKVTYENMELVSDVVSFKLMISEQPTAKNPTVELNYDVDATYQWYSAIYKEYEVVDVVENSDENKLGAFYRSSGEYVDNKWQSEDGQILLGICVEKGETVRIELPDTFDGMIVDYTKIMAQGGGGTQLPILVYEDGVCEVEITSSDTMFMVALSDNVDFEVKMYVNKASITDAIEGETAATLKNPQVNKSYVCKVLYDGKEIVSDVVNMKFLIINQPTEKKPVVEVNIKDEVAKYQWYEVEEIIRKVVDKDLVTSEEIEDVIAVEVESGKYEDGKWVGDAMTYDSSSTSCIQFNGELEAGYTLNIQLSTDDIEIFVMWKTGHEGNYDEIITEADNGLIQIEITETCDYTVGMVLAGGTTADITLNKMDLVNEVESQTTNSLTNHKAGNYLCVVTLKDGSEIYSEIINVTADDIVHTYTDMYDPDCNDCGDIRQVPDRPVDPDDGDTGNGDTGNGGTGNGGTGNGGTENSGAGNNGTGNSGAGNNGTGNSGAGNNGTGNSGAGNNGTGNSAAGNNATGNGGAGSNSANKAPNSGDSVNIAWLMAVAVAAMAGSMLVSLKKKRA